MIKHMLSCKKLQNSRTESPSVRAKTDFARGEELLEFFNFGIFSKQAKNKVWKVAINKKSQEISRKSLSYLK